MAETTPDNFRREIIKLIQAAAQDEKNYFREYMAMVPKENRRVVQQWLLRIIDELFGF